MRNGTRKQCNGAKDGRKGSWPRLKKCLRMVGDRERKAAMFLVGDRGRPRCFRTRPDRLTTLRVYDMRLRLNWGRVPLDLAMVEAAGGEDGEEEG
jgi:hypothetical protein